MTRSEIVEALKNNWYLVLIVVGLLAGAFLMALMPGEEAEDLAGPPAGAVEDGGGAGGAERAPVLMNKPSTRAEKADRDIVAAEDQLASEPDAEETPIRLRNLGNLYYSKKLDYAKAAEYYEDLLFRFPDAEGNRTVYPNLSACYERLGDTAKERWTYERMMEYFGETEQEYLYAKEKLGL